MARFGYASTPTPTPVDSWSSYFDSWKCEDGELPALEPVILDVYEDLHPESLQVKFNADFELDWDMDYLQDSCSPLPLLPSASLATGTLNDAHRAHPRQGLRQGQHDMIFNRPQAYRVPRPSDDVDLGNPIEMKMEMEIDGDRGGERQCQAQRTKIRQRQRGPWLGQTPQTGATPTTGTHKNVPSAPVPAPSATTTTTPTTRTRCLRRTRATLAQRKSSQQLIGDLAWAQTRNLTRTGTDQPANHDTVSAALLVSLTYKPPSAPVAHCPFVLHCRHHRWHHRWPSSSVSINNDIVARGPSTAHRRHHAPHPRPPTEALYCIIFNLLNWIPH